MTPERFTPEVYHEAIAAAGSDAVTVANLSILKNGHARALRFNTLTAICDALGCTPGELLSLED